MTTDTKPDEDVLSEEHHEPLARMSFGEHLDELRKRVLRAMVGSVIGIALAFVFIKDIAAFVAHPYRVAMLNAGLPGIFIIGKPQEVVMAYITLAIEAGLVFSSPWIIYHIWAFVAAGLFPRERKIVYRYVAPTAFLFLLGVSFFYFVVLPMTLSFFISFTANTAGPTPTPTWIERKLLPKPVVAQDLNGLPSGDKLDKSKLTLIPMVTSDPAPPADPGAGFLIYNAMEGTIKFITPSRSVTLMISEQGSMFANFPRLDDYLSFVMFSSLVFGAAFEMPMVIMILAQVGIVEVQTFRNIRKYAYFGLAVISAVVAPSGDLMTMLFLMVPLVILYEVGIVAAAFVTRGRVVAED